MQNQEKLMTQTQEKGPKPSIWAILDTFDQNLGRDIFFDHRAWLLKKYNDGKYEYWRYRRTNV